MPNGVLMVKCETQSSVPQWLFVALTKVRHAQFSRKYPSLWNFHSMIWWEEKLFREIETKAAQLHHLDDIVLSWKSSSFAPGALVLYASERSQKGVQGRRSCGSCVETVSKLCFLLPENKSDD